jgi:hypothetical protein
MMRLQASIALVALCLLVWLSACTGTNRNTGALVPATALGQPPSGEFATDASSFGTAAITVVVPAHPASTVAPAYVSPATQGIGVTVTVAGSNRAATKFFFPLNSSQSYCTGGTASIPLTCRLLAKVPAAKDTFVVAAYAGATVKAPLLSMGTLVRSVPAHGTTAVNISMGGVVAMLQVALDDPFPPAGKKASIPVSVTAADAWGYEIIGNYDVPLQLSDSDKSSATSLNEKTLATSQDAAKLSLAYTGGSLKSPVAVTVAAAGKHAASATATFMPGGKGVVGSPAVVFTSYGIGGASVSLGGPGTTAPYTLSTAADAEHDRSCAGFVTVSGSGTSFVVSATGSLGACWLSATDSSGHKGSLPVLVSGFPWPVSLTSPSPPPEPTGTPFTASTSEPLPAISPPAPGQSPIAVAVPVISSNSRTVSINLEVGSSGIPPGLTLVSTLSNQPPENVGPPQIRRGALHPHDGSSFSTLLFLEMTFGGNVALAAQPTLTFTLPSDQILPNVSYWTALYDPTTPQLGWQLGFEGPGAVNGSAISFTGNASNFYFQSWQPYTFALYALSEQAAIPTPPPTQAPPTPSPTPGATPTPVPTPGFGVTPASLSLTALGQTASLSAAGNAPYSAFTSDASIVTVSPAFGSGPFTATAVSVGSASITLADSEGRTTIVPVTVTTTIIPIQVGAKQ